MTIMAESVWQAGRHGAGVTESSHSDLQEVGRLESAEYTWPLLLKPQIPPTVTHLFSKATLQPNPS